MKHGKGAGHYSRTSQSWLTESYEKKRQKGLRDKSVLGDYEVLKYEISGSQGGGRTDERSFTVKQHPFPETGKKTLDIRKIDPKIGELSD